jgi:uncharacterized protein (TIGR04551 family)
MPRLSAVALAALLAIPGFGRAEEAKAAAPAPGAAAAPEADPRVQAAIQRAVDKAKEEIRNEVRAELQGAQSAAEFMGAVADQPKLQLLDLEGYFRLRWQYLNRLNLRNALDSAGFTFFPKPLHGGSTLTSANMRLRLEPTINASETVRVHMQVDVLDNYVLGSNESKATDSTGSPYPIPFYGSTRTYTPGDKTNDRDPIIPRRAWAEVQTPLGLLSFGRMPSDWGLGILANAGTGLDQDFGDTVDRIQFALPPVGTPLGDLVIVPLVDVDASGVVRPDPHGGAGVGQPLQADTNDAGTTWAFKVVRLDTPDELRRKQERGETSFNFGLYYNYRTQKYVYPAWLDQGWTSPCTTNSNEQDCFSTDPVSGTVNYNRRGASAHLGSLWARWFASRLRIEGELVGVYGTIGNANAGSTDTTLAQERLHMKQWGFVLQSQYQVAPRFSWGVELGAASGDGAPGFGNQPDRGLSTDASVHPNYGAIEGPQWGRPGDRTINNFRFNPAYQVDQILYRRILGQVTDSVYLKPNLHWDIIPGLALDSAAIYSQAQCPESTPSSTSVDSAATNSPLKKKGHRPLGLEFDNKLTLSPTSAFTGWIDLGLLKPLAGMGSGTSMAWMFDFGLAARF